MKKSWLVAAFAVLILFMTACGPSEDEKGNDDSGSEQTLTIEHELDTTDVPKNPEKVIVFDYGVLDSLDKLGVDVTGVPKGIIPEYLKKYESDDYENAGSLKEPDFDKIASIDPDLIIISGRQSTVYDQLKEIAPTIDLEVDPTRYLDSFKENMEVLGEIFDKQTEVDEALETVDDSIAALKEKAANSGHEALIILSNDDKISAYGPHSRFGIIHDVFGVPAADEGIEASTHGMNVTFEYVMEQDPDMLYVVDRSAAINEESAAAQIVENKLVKNTKAYQNDNITYLNPDIWYLSGGGLVSVQQMIDEIDASLED